MTKVPVSKKQQVNKTIVVCHPWSLFENDEPYDVGLFIQEFHNEFQWCDKRWDFVLSKMESMAKSILFLSLNQFIQYTAHVKIKILPTLNPYYNLISNRANCVAINRPNLHEVPDMILNRFHSSESQNTKTPILITRFYDMLRVINV